MWSDTVTVTGTVNTGKVDLVVKKCSNTWVYKIMPGHGIEVIQDWSDNPHTAPAGGTLKAKAVADCSGAANDAVTVTIDKAFPLDAVTPPVTFRADFLLHYEGTIPVRVQLVPSCTGPACSYVTIKYYSSDVNGAQGTEITPILGDQWENCKYVLVVIEMTGLQAAGAAAMDLSGSFSGELKVVQWNEYAAP
jgi:hypothetical protein